MLYAETFSKAFLKSFQLNIDNIKFDFQLGRETADVIFILCQINEKHLPKYQPLYFTFVDLEKTFDKIPRKVLWWVTGKFVIEKLLIRFVQEMYSGNKSCVRTNNNRVNNSLLMLLSTTDLC